MTSAPKPLSSSSHVYFPQQGSHAVHALDTHGKLRTAMIVGGDRLIFLKQGLLVAESSPLHAYVPPRLLTSPTPSASTVSSARLASRTPPSTTPSSASSRLDGGRPPLEIYHTSICVFSLFSFRVAVATNAGILLFELDDQGEVWRNTSSSSALLAATETVPHTERGGDNRGDAPGVSVRSVEALHGVRSALSDSGTTGGKNASGVFGVSGAPSLSRSRNLRCRLIGIPAVIDHQLAAMTPLAKGAIPPLRASSPLGGGREYAPPSAASTFPIRVRHQPTRSVAIRRVKFASEDTLCILSQEEVVLLRIATQSEGDDDGYGPLGTASSAPPSTSTRQDSGMVEGVVLWRSVGTYLRLAVCPVNHHVALTLPGSTVVVFPCKPASTDKGRDRTGGVVGGTASPSGSSSAATPAFSPTTLLAHSTEGFASYTSRAATETPTSALREQRAGPHIPTTGVGMSLSERGLTASLGKYKIHDMRWHRVATHTLLCVTCTLPGAPADEATMMLFTVQSLPVLPAFTNLRAGDGTAGFVEGDVDHNHPVHRDGLVQLIPAGTIPLSYYRASPRDLLHQSAPQQTPPGSGPSSPTAHPADLPAQLVPTFSRSSRAASPGNALTFLRVDGDGTVATSSYRFGQQRHASFAKQRTEGNVATGLVAPLVAAYGALRGLHVLPTWQSRGVEFGAALSGTAELFMSTRRYRFVATFTTGVMAVVMVDLTALVFRVECFLTLGSYRVVSLLSFATSGACANVDGGDGSDTLVAALLGAPEADSGGRADDVTGGETPTTTAPAGVCACALFAQQRTDDGLHTQLLAVTPLTAPDPLRDGRDETDDGATLHISRACSTRDGVALILATRVLHTCARSRPQFVALLPPVTVESLGPAQSGVPVGVVNIPDTQPARWLCAPPGFFESTDEADGTTGASPALAEGTSADLDVLRRVRHQLRSTAYSNEHCGILQTDRVECDVVPQAHTATSGSVSVDITVSAAVLDRVHTVCVPLVDPETGHPRALLAVKSKQLVNNDIVVGVHLGACQSDKHAPARSGQRSVLLLYGLTTAQRVDLPSRDDGATTAAVGEPDAGPSPHRGNATAATLALEHTVDDVHAFFLGGRGEVMTVVQHEGDYQGAAPSSSTVLMRWLRCFPRRPSGASRAGYHYIQDTTWHYGLTPVSSANVPSSPLSAPATSHAITACDAFRWSGARPQRSVKSYQSTQLLLATSACECLLLHETPFATGLSRMPELRGGVASSQVSSYHPDAIMQLIGMARWDLVKALLEQLASAINSTVRAHRAGNPLISPEEVTTPTPLPATDFRTVEPDTALAASCMARRLCTSVVAKGIRGTADLCTAELTVPVVCPPPLELNSAAAQTSLKANGAASAEGTVPLPAKQRFAEVFKDHHVLTYLSECIPQVNIEGLSNGAQMGLLCIVEALGSVGVLSRNVDEAASRFFFLHRLASLRHRLRLPESTGQTTVTAAATSIDPSSILFFEQGKTAARAVTTTSYAWAALSDSQTVLTKALFFSQGTAGLTGDATGGGGLTWKMIERCGAAYWLQSVPQLRYLAEQVARTQYQATKSVTDCALMYCVAQKVGTLAALCKQQSNLRLQAFFLRDFRDEHNREAASANAFAAVGKNMPLYGAAFFILAGDVRSASQIILQRAGNPALALFVLRACGQHGGGVGAVGGLRGLALGPPSSLVTAANGSGTQPPDPVPSLEADLQWYREARRTETTTADVDVWEDVCLSWLVGDAATKISALQRLAQHPTGHPEVLSLLRYVRDGGVVSLAHRGQQFLPPTQEVVSLMRLSRFCFTRRLLLACKLHLCDVETMLRDLVARQGPLPASGNATVAAARVVPVAKTAPMVADYASGTLAFKGFGDDSDDDDPPRTSFGVTPTRTAAATTPSQAETEQSAPSDAELDIAAISSLQAELAYMSNQIRRAVVAATAPHGPTATLNGDDDDDTAPTAPPVVHTAPALPATAASAQDEARRDVVLYALLGSLFLATSAEACTLTKMQWCLTALLEELEPEMRQCEYVGDLNDDDPEASVCWTGDADGDHRTSSQLPGPASPHTYQTFLSVLHLALITVALRARHILLASALLHVPTNVVHLRRLVVFAEASTPASEPLTAVHPCTAFFVVLFHHMRAQLVETVAASEAAGAVGASRASGPRSHLMDPLWLPAPTLTPASPSAADGTAADLDDLQPPDLETAAEDEESDNAEGSTGGTHKSIFDTLMAAAEAEEKRTQSRSHVTGTVETNASRRSHGSPFDAPDGISNAMSDDDDDGGDSLGCQTRHGQSRLHATDEELSSALFSLCALQQYWRVLCELRRTMAPLLQPPTQDTTATSNPDDVSQAHSASPSLPDDLAHRHSFAGWLMVCCAASIATLRFNTLADELVARLMCAAWTGGRRPDVSVLTDPNGVLLETERALWQTSRVLCAALGAAAAEVTVARVVAQEAELAEERTGAEPHGPRAANTWQPPPATVFSATALRRADPLNTEVARARGTDPPPRAEHHTAVLLCQVCSSYAEVFWEFPTGAVTAALLAKAVPSRSLMQALRSTAATHHTAMTLLDELSGCRARTISARTRASDHATAVTKGGTPADSTTPSTTSRGTAAQLFHDLLSAYNSRTTRSAPTNESAVGEPPFAPPPLRVATDSSGGEAGAQHRREDALWCLIKSSWLRRHHTHLSLRQLLLQFSLQSGKLLQQPQKHTRSVTPWVVDDGDGRARRLVVATDRLVLRVCHHSVVYIHFDRSSCDSLVWSSDAGTGVDYGVREVLAGDNVWPLEQQLPERSMATKVFSAGLATALARQQQQSQKQPTRQNAATTTTIPPAASPTVASAVMRTDCARQRPLMGTASMCAPTSHPHLPFFLANHRDGHIDLYPFASPECIACFACPDGTTAITRTSFSPNGYLFCAGLHDGSVAVWHFTAEANNAYPRHCFSDLFAPYAVRGAFFAGSRSSIVCAVGAVLEPHRATPATHARLPGVHEAGGGAADGAVTTLATHREAHHTQVLLSPGIVGDTSANVVTSAPASKGTLNHIARRPVGELILVDLGQDLGHVLVRCAVPFLPEYAVFINTLDAVLCVSLDGHLALYELRLGSLTLIGEAPLRSALTSSVLSESVPDSAVMVVTCAVASQYDPLIAIGTSVGIALILTVEQVAEAAARARARAAEEDEAPYTYTVDEECTGAHANQSSRQGARTPTVDEVLAQRATAFFAPRSEGSVLREATVLSFATSGRITPAKSAVASAGGPGIQTARSLESGGLSNPATFPTCAVLDLQFTPSVLLAGLKDGKVMGVSLISQGLRHAATTYTPS